MRSDRWEEWPLSSDISIAKFVRAMKQVVNKSVSGATMSGWQHLIRWAIVLMFCAHAALAHSDPAFVTFRAHVEAPQNRGVDRPSINPTPQRTLLLVGRKDPRIEIWFEMRYITREDACQSQTIIGRLAGAPEVPQAIDDSVRVPAGQSKFSIPLSLDRYIPGRCGWYPIGILHAEFEPGVNVGPAGTSGVAPIRAEGKRNVRLTWTCRQTTDSPQSPEKPRLRCDAMDYSVRDTIVSAEGGVLTIDISMTSASGE
jgi:hypothetical protein